MPLSRPLPFIVTKEEKYTSLTVRDLAEMRCEDSTKVSQMSVDEAMLEAIRFQRKYEAKEIANIKANGQWRD